MTTIASLVVEVTSDVRKLNSGLSSGQAQLSRLGESAAKTSAILKKGFAFVGILGLAAAVKGAVDEYTQFLQVNAQTSAALKSTGGVANVTQAHVVALSHTLGELSATDDEVVQSMENILLTFPKIQNEVGKGNAIFDRASLAVENLSARLGKDLTSSATMVGKALGDPTKGLTALTRVGVVFTAQQRKQVAEMMKAHDILGAQKVILHELAKEYGGSAKAAGESVSPLVKLRLIWNDLAQSVGAKLVPLLNRIIPLFKFAATNAGILLVAFLGYRALMFVPALLDTIALRLTAVGAVNLGTIATDAAAAASTFSTLAIGAAAAAVAFVGLTAAVTAWDPLNLVSDDFDQRIQDGTIHIARYYGNVQIAADNTQTFSEAQWAAAAGTVELNKHTGMSVPLFDDLAGKLRAARKAAHDWAASAIDDWGLLTPALNKVKDTFNLTSDAAVGAARESATVATRMSNDLDKLDRLPIGTKLKQTLIDLGPAMVDAFVRGGPQRQRAIRTSLKTIETENQDSANRMKAIARAGYEQVGNAMIDGVVKGIVERSPALDTAASDAILEAIAAAKAAAGISSPSKVMADVGRDLMRGLADGIDSRISTITSKLQDLVKMIRHEIGVGAADQAQAFLRDFDDVGKAMDRLATHVSSFRDQIRSGFEQIDLVGSLSDQLDQFASDMASFAAGTLDTMPTAPDLSGSITDMVGQTTALAAMLQKLEKAGLNRSSLADIAAKGPAGMAFGSALLADPALLAQLNAAQKTMAGVLKGESDRLVKAEFGKRIERLSTLILHLRVFLAAIPLPELNDKTRGFIQAIEAMIAHLNSVATPSGGSGGGAGGGGAGGSGTRPSGGNGAPNHIPIGTTPPTHLIEWHQHGALIGAVPDEVVDKLDEALSRKRLRNGALALDDRRG